MRRRIYLLAISFVLVSGQVHAKPSEIVMVHKGYLSGNDWNLTNQVEQTSYVMGFVNGLFAGPLMGKRDDRTEKLATCLEPMNNIQVTAIIKKFMVDHPERWHERMVGLGWSALMIACKVP